MITVSLCMIVKDEEQVIGRCLECVKDLVDEIIIVDTGSTDRTKEIVGRFNGSVYDFEWIDDFSAARNFSFSKATQDYILWLDADDVLLAEDRLKFKKLKENLNPIVDVVMMKYNLGVDEKGEPTLSFFRERLLKRSKNFQWHDPIHEYMDFSGNIINSDICVTHKKVQRKVKRNLAIFEKIISQGRPLSDRNCFYYARELFFNGEYERAIEYYLKFLATEGGYLSNYFDSCIDLSKCYKLKNNRKESLRVLFKSFEFDTPRAEICCLIGYHYKEEEDYVKAVFWFELAANLKKPEQGWGFVVHDCWGFLPCVELGICYYKLGRIEEAIKYNDMAAGYKPEHPVVMQNREFFAHQIRNEK